MKGLFRFFENILRNEGNFYWKENLMIFGIKESLFVTLFSIFMLAFPRCRAILKWLVYIVVFILGMGACGVLFENIYALWESYKFDKKLEATGRTREDVIFGDVHSPEIKES